MMGIMETVTSRDGTPIAYERGGEGPLLVMVHGTTADHSSWEPVQPELRKHFTVYAMDRRGRGESGDGDGSAYDIEREFEDVVAVIDSIDGPADLFGHSYGAICVLEAALRSSQVRRLVLYEGTFPLPEGTRLYPPEALDRARSSLKAGDREGALTTFYRDIAMLSSEEIEMFCSLPLWPARVALAPTIPHEMRAFESYTFAFDPAKSSNLRAPTLLLLGSDSPAIEKAAAEALDAALPDGRIVVMPGQGHLAHRTAPELFAREVVQFLMQAQGASGASRGGDTKEDAPQTEASLSAVIAHPTPTGKRVGLVVSSIQARKKEAMNQKGLLHEVTGQGEPIVLVPGGLSGWLSWIPFAERLAPKRKVIRVQLRSVELAEAGKPFPADYGIPTEREALRTTVDELGLESFDLAGWSHGGFVSLAFALEYPERVRTLTLIEPGAFWIPREIGHASDALAEAEADDRSLSGREITNGDLEDFLIRAGLGGPGDDFESLPQWPVWVRNRAVLSIFGTLWQHTDSLERLRALDVPVLAVKGTETSEVEAAVVDDLVATTPHGRLLELPGGHASHLENMELFLDELTRHTANGIRSASPPIAEKR